MGKRKENTRKKRLNAVAPLDHIISIDEEQQATRVARPGPTPMKFAHVSYDAEDGQFRSQSSGMVANQVISATGITVDVNHMRRELPPRTPRADANQIISPDHFRHQDLLFERPSCGGPPCATPTHLYWRDLPFRTVEPTPDLAARGLIILMPNVARPFANNGKASPYECRHYDLVIAIGPFSSGDCMRYYWDMVFGRTTTINASVYMRPIHRTALPLLFNPYSCFLKLRKCSTCGRNSMRMPRCIKCIAHYCDASCQLRDWPAHRTLCKRMHQRIHNDPQGRTPHNARLAIYHNAPLCPQFLMCTSTDAQEVLDRGKQIPENILRDGNWMPGDELTMLFERS